MAKIYHKKGIIHIDYAGDKFTVSNNKEFLQAQKKIKKNNIDDPILNQKEMMAYDLLMMARKQQIEYLEKLCIKKLS